MEKTQIPDASKFLDIASGAWKAQAYAASLELGLYDILKKH